MSDNLEITEFVKFDEDTGLIVTPRGEIFQSLKNLVYSSFGSDFVIAEGCEMFTFLDLLATSLSQSAGAYKKIYDSIGFVSATGTTLDNAVALAGITRNGLKRSSVDITLSRPTATGKVSLSAPVRIQDSNGNNWESTSLIIFEEGDTEKVATFYASDGNNDASYSISITAYNGLGQESVTTDNGETVYATTWKTLTSVPSNITIQNKLDSVIGEEKESDPHLRYRYYAAMHQNATATVEGLKAKLLNANSLDLSDVGIGELKVPINYIYIYQNNTNSEDTNGVGPHSIWVVVDGKIDEDDDLNIAKIIKYFKSLGVGTSYGKSSTGDNITEGAVTKVIDGEDINFSRAEGVSCYIKIKLNYDKDILNTEEKKQAIKDVVIAKVEEYVNGLDIGNDVLFMGIASAIYELYPTLGYSDNVFDITDIVVSGSQITDETTTTSLSVNFWQYAHVEDKNITVDGLKE